MSPRKVLFSSLVVTKSVVGNVTNSWRKWQSCILKWMIPLKTVMSKFGVFVQRASDQQQHIELYEQLKISFYFTKTQTPFLTNST